MLFLLLCRTALKSSNKLALFALELYSLFVEAAGVVFAAVVAAVVVAVVVVAVVAAVAVAVVVAIAVVAAVVVNKIAVMIHTNAIYKQTSLICPPKNTQAGRTTV